MTTFYLLQHFIDSSYSVELKLFQAESLVVTLRHTKLKDGILNNASPLPSTSLWPCSWSHVMGQKLTIPFLTFFNIIIILTHTHTHLVLTRHSPKPQLKDSCDTRAYGNSHNTPEKRGLMYGICTLTSLLTLLLKTY